MAGYLATTSNPLVVQTGSITFATQAALSYVVGQRVNLAYTPNPAIYMQGTVTAYNPVTGSMTVTVDVISGVYGLQPPWGTQPWGSTGGIFSPWTLTLLGIIPSAAAAPVVPTIIVRALTANGDVAYGQGLQNFLNDGYAVAQIIRTRLLLLQAEWFENLSEGTPLFQNLLGQAVTSNAVALILRERILGTPFVTSISSFNVTYIPTGRSFTFSANVQTAFGSIVVSNIPTSNA